MEQVKLEVGDSVFYRDQRYWIEITGERFVRIADCHIRPESPAPLARNSFFVPVGLVSLAPVTKNRHAKQPTKHAIEVVERKKATGDKDIGDEIAVALRECKDLNAVYKLAARLLKVKEGELKDKYGHLNTGQQRMNLGNRLRGAQKKGLIKL
jgi:hypothetical protein